MPKDKRRRIIIDRADRMLEQSRTLRTLANELRQESADIRREATNLARRAQNATRSRKGRE